MRFEVKGIRFSYDSVPVLEDITFTATGGEVLGVIGPNGSGKTTLLRCLNRTLSPRVGTVLIDGDDIRSLSRRDVARRIGAVPQEAVELFIDPDRHDGHATLLLLVADQFQTAVSACPLLRMRQGTEVPEEAEKRAQAPT